MPEDEVQRRLEERLQRGREVATGNYKDSSALAAATTKWKSATETAIDNLFIGSKALERFQSSGRMGIGIIGLSKAEEIQEVLERHDSRMNALEAIIEALPYMREAAPERPAPLPSWRDRPVTIHMQSGNVNLGNVVGDVTSNVQGLTGGDAEKIKSLMALLAATVVEAELDLETKAEAAEAVEVVSEALQKGHAGRPSAMVRAAIRRIPALLKNVDQALRLWSELHSLLGPHLPPGTI